MPIRVQFHDNNDMSMGYNLHRAEDIITSYNSGSPSREINDILEYYNISRYFDNKLFLQDWDVETIEKYYSVVQKLKAEVGKYLHSVHGDDLAPLFAQVDHRLRSVFFTVLSAYKVTDRISSAQLVNLINSHFDALSLIVQNKALVTKYGADISDLLVHNPEYAETVIDHYYVNHHNREQSKTFMPVELGKEELDTIIRNYVGWEKASPSYLQLISGLKKAGEHPINDRVRLQAYKRVCKFWKDHFDSGKVGVEFGIGVQILDQDEIVHEDYSPSEHVCHLSYSRKWISGNLDFPTLLNNFIFLFKYVDRKYRCLFLSNPTDLSALDMFMGVHGNEEYATGIGYEGRKMQSTLQMYAYQLELRHNNIEIEHLFKWFFEEYLKTEFGVENYVYYAPSPQSSSLERILLIASQIDAVLKQFRLFSEDGRIDRELYEFSSSTYIIVDTPSLIDKKYLYPGSDAIKRELFFLFSDQCMLSYTEKTKGQYTSFAKMLASENVSVKDFPEYDQPDLKWLLKRGTIFEDENGFLRMKKALFILLYDINQNGCVAFSYCSEAEKQHVEKLLSTGDLLAESSLFTKQEQDFLDYMLNVQRFSNGPELRNKYVHGNFSGDLKKHDADYLELLKIMALIVLKINEEFCLKYPSDSITTEVIP